MRDQAAAMDQSMDGQLRRDCLLSVAEGVRNACVRAALESYERASLSGLCHEGAWEAAIDAVRQLDIEALLELAQGTVPDDFPSERQ